MSKRASIAIWAGVGLAILGVGIAAERIPPSNLTMSLLDAFHIALLIGLFIWFMNWPRQPTLWELQKKQREQFRALYDDASNQEQPVKPVEPQVSPPEDPH